MADVKVSDDLAKKFATEKDRDTPYLRWVRAEGLEIISAHYVPNLRTVRAQALAAPRRGAASTSITTPRAPRTIAMSARSRPAKSSRPSASSSRR